MKKVVTHNISENIPLLSDHPLLHKIYVARGIEDPSELDYDLSNLLPLGAMEGVEKAVEMLSVALKENKNILILGDFDTDGATSTALAVLALKVFGLKNVSY